MNTESVVQKSAPYHVHISSKHKLLDLKLKEVFRYRDLIWLFTKRSVFVRYKQTILGPAWIFLNPFITSIIYTIVFGGIAGIGTEGVPKILFYLCSNAIWIFFSSSVTQNASTFTANANVFGKVYFPRLTIPISNVISAIILFGVQMTLVLGFLAYYLFKGEVHPNWMACLAIPVVLVHLGLLGLGVGIIVSSMTTKYRDLAILVGFGVQLWMYATPIVYPISQIKNETLKTIMLINPVSAPVEVFRYGILGQGSVEPLYLGISWIVTIALTLLGIMLFNKVERTFMDTV
ncbi:MAG: ABC transporter permease [Lachnospiraceae bacterium]|nr:ABC transporter permease [Lachnospiraceae bacterium]